MGSIIFITSGKGGTGKTSIAAGIATCLGALGHKTVLVDADIGLRNVDIVLGVSDKAVMHFGDVLKGDVELSEALVSRNDLPLLSILAAPHNDPNAPPNDVRRLMRKLSDEFEFVLIDGPAGISDWVRLMAELSDTVIAVATPDVVSMRDASRISEMLDDLGKSPARLVVNRVRPRLINDNGALYVDDIMDGTGMSLLGLAPEDERVIAAANKGEPLVAFAQDGAALAFRNIALRLLGKRVPLSDIKVTNKVTKAFLSKLNMGGSLP